MKRKADFLLDRAILQKHGLGSQTDSFSKIEENTLCTLSSEEIAYRRILKIKGLREVPKPKKHPFDNSLPIFDSNNDISNVAPSFLKFQSEIINPTYPNPIPKEDPNPIIEETKEELKAENLLAEPKKPQEDPELKHQSPPKIFQNSSSNSLFPSELQSDKKISIFSSNFTEKPLEISPEKKKPPTKEPESTPKNEEPLKETQEDPPKNPPTSRENSSNDSKLKGNNINTPQSIFAASSSLFSSLNNNNSTPFPIPSNSNSSSMKPNISIFEKSADHSNIVNIFQKKPMENSNVTPSEPLFPKPENIFGLPSSNTNAFGTTTPGGGGLFSTLFNQKPNTINNTLPFLNNTKKDSDDEDGGSEAGDENPVEPGSPEIDQSKATLHYQYDDLCEKIISVFLKNLQKFKPGEKSILQSGAISLEKVKNQEIYYVVYRNQAKLAMYKGIVVKKLTVAGTLNKKADSMTLVLFSEQKDQKERKLSKDVCKIMFYSQKECEEFKREVEKITV